MHVCGSAHAILRLCGVCFSFSNFTWVSGIKVRLPGLGSNCLYPLSLLCQPDRQILYHWTMSSAMKTFECLNKQSL